MVCMQERRSEVRMLCADLVEVCWTDRTGKRQKAMALLEDISPSGGCLQVENALPLGSQIVWACARQRFEGWVRYCVYREIGYFVGIEFAPCSKWSKKAYRPQHLLDLKKLVARAKA